MKTGWASVKLALTACIGVFLISVAVEGQLFTKVNVITRVICFAAAFLLIDSGRLTDIIGIVICAAIVIFQKTLSRKHVTIVT